MSGAPNDGIPPAGGAGGDVTPNWWDGSDAETVGYIQNRGLDKGDAKTAALAAIKSHREAEKFLGAKAEDLVRIPKDGNDATGWKTVHSRLGVPAEAKDYDFADVKFGDGSPLKADFAEFLQKTFHANNVSKSAAAGVAKEVVSYLEKLGENNESDAAAKLAIEEDTLKKEWSFNYNQNKIVAENAARALGVTEDELNTLEKSVGYARVMEMFRNIGEKIGEDKFVRNGAPGGKGAMTIAQATDQLETLKQDRSWVQKLENGDAETNKQFQALTQLIASGKTYQG